MDEVRARPLGHGIDFGTSNSSVPIACPDRVDILALLGSDSRTLP